MEQGKFDEAETCLDEALQVTRKTKNLWLEASIRAIQAISRLYQDCPQEALAGLQEYSEHLEKMPGLVQAGIVTLQAFANRQIGDRTEAQNLAKRALGLIREEDFGNIDILPDEILWWCYRTLAPDPEQGTPEISDELWQVLEMGRRAMMTLVEGISDAGLRRGYLHRVRFRRLLVNEWLKWADTWAGKDKLAAYTAVIRRPGRLKEIFRRLLTVGVRLNAQRDPVRLPEQILEEVSELIGAERIALVLLDEQGGRRMEKTLLPRPIYPVMSVTRQEPADAGVFLAEINPFVQETIDTRQGFIRYLNPESKLTDQRSLLAVPLISQSRLVGVICCDLAGCFGRFDPEDLDLLGVLANQSAVAVENADWSATLEEKVVKRTAELEETNASLEQRTRELTIINRVQEGLVKQLDFQAIIDMVGDEIMRTFPAPQEKAELYSVYIALYDQKTNAIQIPYWLSGTGERINPLPVELGAGLTSLVIINRQALVLNNADEQKSLGGIFVEDGNEEETQSWMGVPILIGEHVSGAICLQDGRPNLYKESDVRLLSTLAAGLGTALENARLFKETQRLLEETGQRNNELAILNSVGEAMAKTLDVKTITRIVGDKVRDIFDAEVVAISLFDEQIEYDHRPIRV